MPVLERRRWVTKVGGVVMPLERSPKKFSAEEVIKLPPPVYGEVKKFVAKKFKNLRALTTKTDLAGSESVALAEIPASSSLSQEDLEKQFGVSDLRQRFEGFMPLYSIQDNTTDLDDGWKERVIVSGSNLIISRRKDGNPHRTETSYFKDPTTGHERIEIHALEWPHMRMGPVARSSAHLRIERDRYGIDLIEAKENSDGTRDSRDMRGSFEPEYGSVFISWDNVAK